MFSLGSLLPSLISGGLSILGGQRRNEAQLATAREVMKFNAEQAQLDRDFQADQAGIARGYSSTEAAKARRHNYHTGLKFMRDAFALNERGARENRAWQERMSSTQMSRQVADMKRAGLNPILAIAKPAAAPPGSAPVAPGGSGSGPAASTPGVPGGRAANGVLAHLENVAANAGASAVATYRAGLEADKTRQEISESRARQREAEARTITEGSRDSFIQSQTLTQGSVRHELISRSQANTARALLDEFKSLTEQAQYKLVRAQTDYQVSAAQLNRTVNRLRKMTEAGAALEEQIDQGEYALIMRYLQRLLPAVNSASGALRTFKPR